MTGTDMLVERTRVPVCGVVPYFIWILMMRTACPERFAGKQEWTDRYCSYPFSEDFEFYRSGCA